MNIAVKWCTQKEDLFQECDECLRAGRKLHTPLDTLASRALHERIWAHAGTNGKVDVGKISVPPRQARSPGRVTRTRSNYHVQHSQFEVSFTTELNLWGEVAANPGKGTQPVIRHALPIFVGASDSTMRGSYAQRRERPRGPVKKRRKERL